MAWGGVVVRKCIVTCENPSPAPTSGRDDLSRRERVIFWSREHFLAT
jgi:hypothetical protein